MTDLANEAFFRQMCLRSGVAITATDEQLRIRFWNPAAARLFGRSADEMIGQPVTTIVPPDRLKAASRLFERTLQHGQISEFEFEHRDPAGITCYLAVSIAPVVNEQGKAIGISAHCRDVSRRIETERITAEDQKMSALGLMAGAVAHHFNNLLAGLITTADFSQSSTDPHVLQRALKSIITTLTRASKLTHALLAFAEGAHDDSPTEDVTSIVREFLTDVEPALQESCITLQTDIQEIGYSLPTLQVHTILECLISNALDAMPAGGTLRVNLIRTSDERDMVLRIGDNGRGISEEDLGRVFEPFFTTKSEELVGPAGHPGLGLAVVHGIVHSLGGTATLCSSQTDGTICSIQLPCNS